MINNFSQKEWNSDHYSGNPTRFTLDNYWVSFSSIEYEDQIGILDLQTVLTQMINIRNITEFISKSMDRVCF